MSILLSIVVFSGDATGDATGEVATTVARLDTSDDSIEVISVDAGTAVAEGINDAVAAARGAFVAFVDTSVDVDAEALLALVVELRANPGVGVLVPRLRTATSTNGAALDAPAVRNVLSASTAAGRALAPRHHRDTSAPSTIEYVDAVRLLCAVTWTALALKRPMEQSLPLALFDADFCARIRSDGYVCAVAQQVQARATSTDWRDVTDPAWIAEYVISARRYSHRHFGLIRCATLWLGLLTAGILGLAGSRRARLISRGTLAGLGAPTGVRAVATKVPRMGPRPRHWVVRARAAVRPALRAVSRRMRRRLFVTRVRAAAWLSHSPLEVHVHPTADLGRHIQLEFVPRRPVRLTIGEHSRVQPHVHLRLGGELEIGRWCEIRTLSSVHVRGRLHMLGRNILGRGTIAHAATDQVWEFGAGCGEYVGVADSEHAVDGSPLTAWTHPVTVRPTRLGAGALISAHAFVTAGCTVGAGSVIGANTVVTKDIPPGVLAVGAPARVVRVLPFADLQLHTSAAEHLR